MLEIINEMLNELLHGNAPRIEPDMLLTTDLGLNSLAMFDLICAIEQRFGIEVPDTMLSRFFTVNDVVLYLEQAAGGKVTKKK